MLRNPRDLVASCVEVSSLPAVFLRLNEAINSPRSSIIDMSKIIAEDPGLTARLLRLVNSSLYSFPGKIETISRAVVIVGVQQLRELALATSVMKLFEKIPEDLASMESFWAHSVACGLAARILASHRRDPNVERFFVAGILHDVGKLVIYSQSPDLAREALRAAAGNGSLLHEAEAHAIGFDHTFVGRLLVRAWKLPASLEEVAGCHHAPALATRFPVEAAVVHLADILAHVLQLGASGQIVVPPLDPQAWDLLGIPAGSLVLTLEQVERQFSDVLSTLLPNGKPCVH
jgi:HD-like signal output (HDOD) protein